MKIAFQMEPPDQFTWGEDNSLLLMEEGCKRGFQVFHYQPGDISLSNEGLTVPAARFHLSNPEEGHYTLDEYQKVDLATMDVIFFRQNPPFDMKYFTNTLFLERLRQAGVLCVNDPFWIRNLVDKFSVFDYPEYLPPTLVSSDLEEIKTFLTTHGELVVKPLYSFHGHGIFKSASLGEIKKAVEESPEPLMFQPFLPEVYDGNKRLLLFDGEYVGAIKSVPQKQGDFRIYRDSEDIAYEATDRELALCAAIGEMCKERGLIFVGLDLIGDYLIEINVGSVGSLLRFNKVYGDRYEAKLWDVIERQIQTKTS